MSKQRVLYKCACEHPAFFEILHFDEDKEYYVSLIEEPKSFKDRIWLAFNILFTGGTYQKEIILTEEQMSEMMDVLYEKIVPSETEE